MSSAGLFRRQLPFALRGLDTDNDSVFIERDLAELLPRTRTRLDPLARLTGPGEWCEEHKLHLDALTRNAVYLNRRQQTAYELTPEGQKAFARVVGMQSMNGYASTMNTDESKPLGLLSLSERF